MLVSYWWLTLILIFRLVNQIELQLCSVPACRFEPCGEIGDFLLGFISLGQQVISDDQSLTEL